ncbi:MAG: ABC transporter permease [Halobacteriota archaeon]|nr:ABC transporter permease [Halobacteriota archaeon]
MATNIGNIYLNDFKNIFRDSILIYGLISPLLVMVITRLVVPQLGWIPSTFYPHIEILTILISPVVFGFIAGFIILDEKDDNVFLAIRVLPISVTSFIIYRMLFSIVMSFVYSILAVAIIGLVEVPFYAIIPIAALIAIEAPIIALILSIFSDNKVEGVAMLKGLNFVFLLLPVAALFIPGRWQYVAGVIPTFWPVKAFIEVASGASDIWGLVLAGVVVHLIYLGGLARRFGSKDL